VEVIETATPQTFYETTRRKFGMVGGLVPTHEPLGSLLNPFPNLFLVGDSVASTFGIAGAAMSGYSAAKILTDK
jgi:phytoene dehydrogenase-like protein